MNFSMKVLIVVLSVGPIKDHIRALGEKFFVWGEGKIG